jgi:hypothetical protein
MTVIGHGYDDNVGAPAFRNVIINGGMSVAQRNTSVANITTSGYNTSDRWRVAFGALGTWTQSVENDAPTGSGLRKSCKMLCTTADASPAAGDYAIFQTLLEGQNLQHFAKGTSSAKKFAVSFWVKSNKTGTYVLELFDADNSRHCAATYTVNSSDTWEKKTIIIPADLTGAFDNDNASSLEFNFWLAAGSTFSGGTLTTTWASAVNGNRAAGVTNLAAATNNYWQVTGVQLEPEVATPFEFEPFETTLRKCQRYFTRLGLGGSGVSNLMPGATESTTAWVANCPAPVAMRAKPTGSFVGTVYWFNAATTTQTPTITQQRSSQTTFALFGTIGATTAGQGGSLYVADPAAGNYIDFNAEL